jgi:hypothetical protein
MPVAVSIAISARTCGRTREALREADDTPNFELIAGK